MTSVDTVHGVIALALLALFCAVIALLMDFVDRGIEEGEDAE